VVTRLAIDSQIYFIKSNLGEVWFEDENLFGHNFSKHISLFFLKKYEM